jgi:hypothetical protein
MPHVALSMRRVVLKRRVVVAFSLVGLLSVFADRAIAQSAQRSAT